MLETVKAELKEGPCIDISFSEFYQQFVCEVQDKMIDQELKQIEALVGYSNYLQISKLIDQENIKR